MKVVSLPTERKQRMDLIPTNRRRRDIRVTPRRDTTTTGEIHLGRDIRVTGTIRPPIRTRGTTSTFLRRVRCTIRKFPLLGRS